MIKEEIYMKEVNEVTRRCGDGYKNRWLILLASLSVQSESVVYVSNFPVI